VAYGFIGGCAEAARMMLGPVSFYYSLVVFWLLVVRSLAHDVRIEAPELVHLPLLTAIVAAFGLWTTLSLEGHRVPGLLQISVCLVIILKLMLIRQRCSVIQGVSRVIEATVPGARVVSWSFSPSLKAFEGFNLLRAFNHVRLQLIAVYAIRRVGHPWELDEEAGREMLRILRSPRPVAPGSDFVDVDMTSCSPSVKDAIERFLSEVDWQLDHFVMQTTSQAAAAAGTRRFHRWAFEALLAALDDGPGASGQRTGRQHIDALDSESVPPTRDSGGKDHAISDVSGAPRARTGRSGKTASFVGTRQRRQEAHEQPHEAGGDAERRRDDPDRVEQRLVLSTPQAD
jgi:hypothetical protein